MDILCKKSFKYNKCIHITLYLYFQKCCQTINKLHS